MTTRLCPCGKKLNTKQKKFCSMPCYRASEDFRLVYDFRKTGHETTCKGCGKSLYQPKPSPGRHAKRYCNQECRRRFYAERFDRHIDSHTIQQPQCFDEFMTQDALPCLVEGCDWKGHGLAQHMNHAHNIKADDAKELGGFNKSTGLVSPSLREKFAECNRESGGVDNFGGNFAFGNRTGFTARAEAKEHHSKASLAQWDMRKEVKNDN